MEFTVQLLQLVHGRADETIRSPSTLTALAALAAGGYVGRWARPGDGARGPARAVVERVFYG